MERSLIQLPGSSSEVQDLVELLRLRARHHADRRAFVFLEGNEQVDLTYAELDRRARQVAAELQRRSEPGQRALLLYPPGPDYLVSFFGCLYAGVVAVPAYPPDPARMERTLPRLQAIVADAQATLALSTAWIAGLAPEVAEVAPELGSLEWIATDGLAPGGEAAWCDSAVGPDSLAFLQYTSGSTRTPRGVMVSHANLLRNAEAIARAFGVSPESLVVSWLPPYHDMGLIGGLLQPIFAGFPCVALPPMAFLQRPVRWLEAISQYRATHSGGPNFAYDLCVRRTTAEEREGLDLSSWRLAFNGAEPVRAQTLARFAVAFAPYGFRPGAFYPCYGLAEATLFVSGGVRGTPVATCSVQPEALARNEVLPAVPGESRSLELVSSGRPSAVDDLRIVDPSTRRPCLEHSVGEIWIRGSGVARGYWNQPDESRETFAATLDDGEGPFLRTGDLGFLRDGQLYITGRLKDLIIIRGRNHYPQDIELTVEGCHGALRPGSGAAFTIEADGEERLVVVQEVDAQQMPDLEAVAATIRRAVAEAHEIQVWQVALIAPRSIPKTSSGKIQRSACRAALVEGRLELLCSSVLEDGSASPPTPSAVTRATTVLHEMLTSAEPALRASMLHHYLRAQAAQLLGIAASQIDLERPLSAYGLDSLVAVELAVAIEAEVGVAPPLERVLGGSIAEISGQLLAALATPLAREAPAAAPALAPAEHPISYGQRALWFLQQLMPQSAAHNIVNAVRIPAPADAEAMRRAFQRIVDRHAALRTTFADREGAPVQIVHPHHEVSFQVVDAADRGEAWLKEQLSAEVYRPFDLEQGPLLRVSLFRRAEDDYILVVALHHLATDLWSLAIMLYELGELYAAEKRGIQATLKPLPLHYSDYVRQQNERLAGPEGERLWAYWQAQLSGDLPVLNLPTDRARPPVQSHRGSAQSLRLKVELTAALRSLGQAYGTNLYTVALAGFASLLYRYTGQQEILIGSPRAGRSADVARLMGYFVNMVVLRANLAGDPTFAELLGRVDETMAGALEHGDFPFALLVERLQPARDLSRSPLFQVAFAWQKTTGLVDSQTLSSWALSERGAQLKLSELPMEAYPLDERPLPVDLTLLIAEAGDELAATIEYNSDLFDAEMIAQMLGHLETLLTSAAAHPEERVATLPMLTPAELRQIVHDWNASIPSYTSDLPVQQLFEEQVERTPGATALEWAGGSLSYRLLNARANRLAHYLRRLGVGPEILVGISAERTPELIVAVLGVLKAGGAFLPLDPSYPRERLSHMLADGRPQVLLKTSAAVGSLDGSLALPGESVVVRLDASSLTIGLEPDTNLPPTATPEHLAYVIYTSGSTGVPKGALLGHKGLTNLVRAQIHGFGIAEGSRVLQFASFSFDAAISEIFMALLSGGTLCLMQREDQVSPQALQRLLREQRITVVTLPPSLLALLSPDGLDDLTTVISAGESLPGTVAERWNEGRRLFNAYGPTEATIGPTFYEVMALPPGAVSVPIGRPIPNMQIFLLDRGGQLVPARVPGEIHIGGIGLARGYLNQPELTAERFVELDLGAQPAGVGGRRRVYRTGDLARYRRDGTIEFLGRLDQQVKLRGFRIELGEIEAVLGRHPQIEAVSVQVAADGAGNERLVAYLVSAKGGPPAASELRALLREHLPDYMVPAAYVALAALPLTPNGKVDRRALPAPDQTARALDSAYVAPRTAVEQELAELWAQLLRVDQVGVTDNFFELGGHSLLATQLLARVRGRFGAEVRLQRFFELPTIEMIALELAQGRLEQVDSAEIEELLAVIEQLSDDEARELLEIQVAAGRGEAHD